MHRSFCGLNGGHKIVRLLPLVSLIGLAWACSKDTKGKFAGATKVESLPSQTQKASSDDVTVDPLAEIERLRRESRDNNDVLKALIDQERAERIAADKQLDDKIKALEERINALETALRKDIADLRTQDEAQVAELAALQKKLDALQAQQSADRAQAQAELDAFKEYVASTYATKAELDNLTRFAQGVAQTTALLAAKIDTNDAAINERLTKELKAAKDELAQQISGVQAQVDSVKKDLADHIKKYEQDLNKITQDALAESAKLQSMIAQNRAAVDSDIAKINEFNKALQDKVLGVSAYIQQVEKALGDKIQALEQDSAATGAELQQEILNRKADLARVVAERQAAEARLQEQLDKAAAAIEEVRKIAVAAQQASEANAQAIDQAKKDNARLEQQIAAVDQKLSQQISDMKNQLNSRIDAVEKAAQDATRELGDKVQKEFATLAASLGGTQDRLNGLLQDVVRLLTQHIQDPQKLPPLAGAVQNPFQLSAQALQNFILALANVEMNFIKAFSPENQSNKPFHDAFIPVQTLCGGKTGTLYPNALERDDFILLARVYVTEVLSGVRTLDPKKDRIFFAVSVPPVKPDTLAGITVLSQLNADGANQPKTCTAAIRAWALAVLYADTPQASALRDVLFAQTQLRQAVDDLRRTFDALTAPLAALEKALRDQLRPVYPSEKDLVKALYEGLGQIPALLPQVSALLAQVAQLQLQVADLTADKDRYVNIAKDMAKLRDQTNANTQAIADLDRRVALLEQGLADLKKNFTDFSEKQGATNRFLFNALASIALRLNDAELMKYIQEGAQKYTGTAATPLASSAPIPAAVTGIRHYYKNTNSATCAATNATWRGPGGTVWIAGAGAGQTSWYNSCWVNFRQVPVQSTAAVGQLYGFTLRVFGAASQLRVRSRNQGFPAWTFDKTYPTADKIISGSQHNGVFDVPAAEALGQPEGWQANREIHVTALNQLGQPGTQVASYVVVMYSPLVLSFEDTNRVHTLNPVNSGVTFDLNADGSREQTGWLQGNSGFLVVPNAQGRVKDGSQMFGEATLLPSGKRAANGFEALASLDANGDGFVSQADPGFKKLAVWFDRNQNGASEPWELKSLAELGVTRIETAAHAVSLAERVQNHGLPHANELRTQARYWGPERCKAAGCAVYDVYFGAFDSKLTSMK